jgi:hypothetical protein
MEIKVHVNGAVRIIHGLNKATTVQDILSVLARSLNLEGRHFLIEMKRLQDSTQRKVHFSDKNNIRLMSSSERPIDRIKKYSAYTDMQASFVIEFYLITADKSFDERPVDCGEDFFIYLLNSMNLKRAALEGQLSDLNNGKPEESDVLIEMLETRLRAQHLEIEDRKRQLERLESENQLLNCQLYRIVGKELVNLEALGFLDKLDDTSTTSSSSEAMSDSSMHPSGHTFVKKATCKNQARRSDKAAALDNICFF